MSPITHIGPIASGAGDISSVPGDFIKNFLIFAIFLLMVAVFIKQFFPRRRPEPREITNQPLEIAKASKRYNHDREEGRHQDIDRRLNTHDKQISEIQQKISDELPEMERRLNQSGEDRSSAIHGRINEVLEKVSEVRGEIKTLRREI